MTKTPTPASHAVNTAPISADLRGIEQDAPQHVATVWVDNDGCNDFELSPFFSLPAGEHKLYTHAAALQAAPPAPEAWMDPLTQDVINDARKRAWLTDFGAAGANKAAAYTVALGSLAPPAPAGVAVPEGWTACRIEHEPGYPEDVAYGPKIMMDRLKKWLDRHFAALAAAPAQAVAVPQVFPLQGDESDEDDLSPWQAGGSKPATEGRYLRDFDEGMAISWFSGGEWTRDGFFASDIQDAPWRGLSKPAAPAQEHATQLADQGPAAPLGMPWRDIADGIPAWTDDSTIRVIAVTANDDFGGVQVHDIPAAEFHDDQPFFSHVMGERGSEVTRACTHWAYRDEIWPRASAAAPIQAQEDARDGLTQAARDVLAERQRQISAEGWTPEHDDVHGNSQLAIAAACYAGNAAGRWGIASAAWPWDGIWWKPSTPRRDLEKAGALILAEMERLDRAAARAAQGGA